MAQTKINKKTKSKTEQEKLYRVLLHNDNKTTMEFVVCILMGIFEHTEKEAEQIMLAVHEKGVGTAGVYTLKTAEDKANQTISIAALSGYPLECSVEPD
jgi:ATP-dependent Clp protease adaptor protein ClpS